jgi:hypothetical protein
MRVRVSVRIRVRVRVRFRIRLIMKPIVFRSHDDNLT